MCTGSSSTTQLPSWLTSGAQQLFQGNLNFLNQPYQVAPYLGSNYFGKKSLSQMVAPLNTMQTSGFQGLQNLYQTGADSNVASDAQALVGKAANAPLSQIDPTKTADFVNPYIQGVLAPTLRNIGQQESLQQQQLNDSAISMGAFGDARQGIEAGQIYKQADVASGDVSNQAYSQAWQNALQQQQANAQLAEQGYGRMMQGAQTGYGIYSANQQQQLQNLQALLQGGQAQQQQAQNRLDARSGLWQQIQQSPYDKLAAAVSLLSGVGSVAPRTTSQDTGMGGFLGLLGSLGGAAVSGLTGGVA